RLRAQVGDRNIRATRGKPERDGTADALCSPGDERDLARERARLTALDGVRGFSHRRRDRHYCIFPPLPADDEVGVFPLAFPAPLVVGAIGFPFLSSFGRTGSCTPGLMDEGLPDSSTYVETCACGRCMSIVILRCGSLIL